MPDANAAKALLANDPFVKAGVMVPDRVKDVAAATALAAEDPSVKAGRLKLEACPWMTFKGILK
ncbi:MAG TPA: hypothetical protein VFK57_23130 [Vicinamibacterales bacterium]|nr:hypothetical protein [Vicinamibacterales bacterium]